MVSVAGQSIAHDSAIAQVTGEARYIDDIPEIQGTRFAAPILSTVAHGKFHGLEIDNALAMPGVIRIITANDIVGDKMLATHLADEPIFALDHVAHVGQVLGLVIADSVMNARRAARKVIAQITPLPPILDLDEAIRAESFVLPTVVLQRGNADHEIQSAPHQRSGEFSVGGQEHFYLEGQVALVIPQEQRQWLVYSSTQHPGEVQHWVSHALGVDQSKVRVECRRMGGGFGGKETQAGQMAVWAAVAAHTLSCPIKLRLDRDDDFMITGKRHPFLYRYTVGFDEQGRIAGLRLMMAADCGFSADLSGPVADRAIFHCDNAYYLGHLHITSYRCKTNRQSHTAFRGFGGPQGMILIETIMGEIARALGCDPLTVRKNNLYGITERNRTHYDMLIEDNILLPLLTRLEASSHYQSRRDEIRQWNQCNSIIKRGIAITPVKFGISFTATHFNQAGALVHVYTDGSVLINHGGTEMGQGLHTKVCQIVADVLGLAFSQVSISASDTAKVANASATAASSGTDLNARAAEHAALEIRERLIDLLSTKENLPRDRIVFEEGRVKSSRPDGSVFNQPFTNIVKLGYQNRIQLWSDGFYKTPKIHYDKQTLKGRPFFYFSYGAACTEVIIDTLTGENRVTRVDILHDVGSSINPAIDIGQIEGGFIQGMGWLTTEELVWDAKGRLTTHAPSTYKIPAAGDTPDIINIALWPEPNREDNIFGSKAVGEPPLMLAISVWEAIRDAVSQSGGPHPPPRGALQMNAPATPEQILRAVQTITVS
jgi:xanthine dehydrogenase large subunit